MQPAAEAMARALNDVEIMRPKVPVVANVLAQPETDSLLIRSLLVDQVTGAVRWRESVMFMAAQGVTSFYEVGAGKALSGMIKRIDRGLTTATVGTPEEVVSVAAAINK